MEDETDVKASLEVAREDFEEALKTFGRTIDDREWRSAFLEFEDGSLVIECGNVTVGTDASGHWPGRVRISSAILARAARALPQENPLTVAVDGDQLLLGSLRLNCAWNTGNRPRLKVPLHANLKALLKISRRYDRETIRASGIAAMVGVAEDRLREKLDRASRYLENLGVTRKELQELVEAKLEASEEPDGLLGPNQKELPLRYDGDQLIFREEEE